MTELGLPGHPPGASDELHLRDVLRRLTRNRWLVLGCLAATLLAGALFTMRQTPVYASGATLRIDEEEGKDNIFRELSPLRAGPSVIETEILVLQSRAIVGDVVDSLGLQVAVVDPKIARDNVLASARVPHDAVPGIYLLERQRGDSWRVVRVEGGRRGPLPAGLVPGVPFALDGARLVLSPRVRGLRVDRVRLAIGDYWKTVAGAQRSLSVSRPNRDAKVIGVSFLSTDSVIAAAVPNAVARSFIAYKAQTSKTESRSTVGFLRQQVVAYEQELRDAEVGLRNFREQAQVVSPTDQATEEVRRLAALQARRDELVAERTSLAQLLARADADRGTPGGASPYRQLASFPTFLVNQGVQDILRALNEVESKRADLLVRRTHTDEDVTALDQRQRDLELQLYRTARGYLQSLDSQISSHNATVAQFSTQLQRIPATEIELARLMRKQKLLEDIYTLLQTRLKEGEIREASDPGNVRVLDAALVPDEPISPRPLRNMALAMILGLALGAVAAYGREALDNKVRTAEDTAAATGGLALLGTIPRIRPMRVAAAANGNGNGNGNGKKHGPVVSVSPDDFLVTRISPRSNASEAYRALRTSITFSSADQAPGVLVITSAMPGEGKSTSAANLAVTLAQQGVRALLIDADLRKGYLHRVFDVPQSPGLIHVLLSGADLDATIHRVPVDDSGATLDFLTAGVFPPNPSELLGSERMRRFLETVRGQYEMVVFDAPPLNLVTDAAVLGRLADAVILITRAGVTDRGALTHAAAQLRNLGVPVSGVVLNDLTARNGGYGYGYGYGYGAYGAENEP